MIDSCDGQIYSVSDVYLTVNAIVYKNTFTK